MSSDPDIVFIRDRLEMSRSDLAKAAGVDVSTVCRWENNGVPKRGSARALLDRLSADASKAKPRRKKAA